MRTIYKCTGCEAEMPVMTDGPDARERRCACGCKMAETASGQDENERLVLVKDETVDGVRHLHYNYERRPDAMFELLDNLKDIVTTQERIAKALETLVDKTPPKSADWDKKHYIKGSLI